MARRDIERKHLRIDPPSELIDLWPIRLCKPSEVCGVQHVHRVGVTERMGVTGTENVTRRPLRTPPLR